MEGQNVLPSLTSPPIGQNQESETHAFDGTKDRRIAHKQFETILINAWATQTLSTALKLVGSPIITLFIHPCNSSELISLVSLIFSAKISLVTKSRLFPSCCSLLWNQHTLLQCLSIAGIIVVFHQKYPFRDILALTLLLQVTLGINCFLSHVIHCKGVTFCVLAFVLAAAAAAVGGQYLVSYFQT